MKFVSYLSLENDERAGIVVNNQVIDLELAAKELILGMPKRINEILQNTKECLPVVKQIEKAALDGRVKPIKDQVDIKLLAPVPHPPSCRDAYAFKQHVAAARRNRGTEMIPEYDQFPIFYFTNHNAIIGAGDLRVEADHLKQLDFELEVAIVIGKRGKNISVQDADSHIFGYTIMNDFSARQLQMEEMKLSLGPAKGKDFATAIGPWLVTVDELETYKIPAPNGNRYNLEMKAWHNGKQVSAGNLKDMDWTFAEIIERASYGVELYPGDVIGSGTVGSGCYMELNGTWALQAKEKGEKFTPVWLKNGDSIDLEVTGLGKLSHKVVKAEKDYSILAKKKNV